MAVMRKSVALSIVTLFLLSMFISYSETFLSIDDVIQQNTEGRSTACSNNLCINEVLPNPSGYDDAIWPNGEWLEVENRAVSPINLTSGWHVANKYNKIMNLNSSHIVGYNSTDSNTWILMPGDFAVIARDGYSNFYLTNSNESLSLVDNNGITIHIADTINAASGVSYEADISPTQTWVPTNSPSPGTNNSGTVTPTYPTCSDICFSEVFPNPSGNDQNAWPNDEWIELVNNDTVVHNLSGWKFTDNTGVDYDLTNFIYEFNQTLESDWNMEPDEIIVLSLNGSTSIILNNNEETLHLKNPQGDIQHTIRWTNAPSGISLIEPESGGNLWYASPFSTRGYQNVYHLQDTVNGSGNLSITEVLAYPNEGGSTLPSGVEWIEVYNNGNESVNLLDNWTLRGSTFYSIEINLSHIYSEDPTNETGLLESGDYAVLTDTLWLDNFREVLWLISPNSEIIQAIHWNTSVQGMSLIPENGSTVDKPWVANPDPSPGESDEGEVVSPPELDLDAEFVFTRLMPGQIYNRNNEFFELVNTGDEDANLKGWKIQRTKTDGSVDTSILSASDDLILSGGEKLAISLDSQNLSEDGGIQSLNADSVMSNSLWMYDSGVSMQLLKPNDEVVDTVVYGTGPTNVEGWNGNAIEEPSSTSFNGLIFIRGNGCDNITDTNSSNDWHHKWSRLGASQECIDDTITEENGYLTPMAAPDGALRQLTDWIDSAQSSLHIHMYQLTSHTIADNLIDAADRGVDITIVLEDNPYTDAEERIESRGIAWELWNAGITVLWFGETSNDDMSRPYRFIHSKIAVKDGNSVWVGSGNWKDSSFPRNYNSGNVDWGVFVDSITFASNILSTLAWDEETNHVHITAYDPNDSSHGKPSANDGWYGLVATDTVHNEPTIPANSIEGEFTIQTLICPLNCVENLVESIDSADTSIDLSLQYLDLDWEYGWGESPIIAALAKAATRGVKIRLIMNAYYLDSNEEVQEALDLFNENWNRTSGHDTTAIAMSTGEGITKLHNKGMIIDGEKVLVSSINWGSSSIMQTKEVGVLIENDNLANWFSNRWNTDWERLDTYTDTDEDGLPDWWEIQYGLNRTFSSIPGDAISEHSYDADGDGLTNLLEYQYGGDPLKYDTDSDCINDWDEIAFAMSRGIPTEDALTMTDADQNNTNDGEETDCGNNIEDVQLPPELSDSDGDGIIDSVDQCENTESGQMVDGFGCSELQKNPDEDLDGVSDNFDQCPNTLTGELVDVNGCSPNQLVVDSDGDGVEDQNDECPNSPSSSSVGSNGCTESQALELESAQDILPNGASTDDTASMVMLGIMVAAGTFLIGSLALMYLSKRNGGKMGDSLIDSDYNPMFDDDMSLAGKKSVSDAPLYDAGDEFASPVLGGQTESVQEPIPESDEEYELPGWDQDVINAYLESGWSMRQLREWYEQQEAEK